MNIRIALAWGFYTLLTLTV